jgi:hypothetical protein
MTRREADVKLRLTTERYHEVLALLVAIVRRQGSLYIDREALADVEVKVWGLHTEPTPDGAGISVSAVRKGDASPATAESHAVN